MFAAAELFLRAAAEIFLRAAAETVSIAAENSTFARALMEWAVDAAIAGIAKNLWEISFLFDGLRIINDQRLSSSYSSTSLRCFEAFSRVQFLSGSGHGVGFLESYPL